MGAGYYIGIAVIAAFPSLVLWATLLTPRGAFRTVLLVVNGPLCMAAWLLVGASLYDNWQGGCFGAPSDVPFHQGMTICPGQTAHGSIRVYP
jgi:hypothetical protein